MPNMDGVKSTLTHKVGPLPLWGYGVAAGGVLVIVRARRKSKSASSSAGEQKAASQFALDPSAYGYQGGQNFGGTTSGDVMSMFQTLQSQLGAIQQAAAAALPGAAAAPGSAGPQPSATSSPWDRWAGSGKFATVNDPGWRAGGGEIYETAWDYFGPGQGVGVNELAQSIQRRYGVAVSPAQLAAWNGGRQFFSAGQQVYIGSKNAGVGH